MTEAAYTVVVPTVGRPSLVRLLQSLAASEGPAPTQVILVDDRREPAVALGVPDGWEGRVLVVSTGGRGPAAARNAGWRAARTDWVAFVDDDVVLGPQWAEQLAEDLRDLPWEVAGSQGRLRVPLPGDRLPTDWERNVAALATARWITADMAYRRDVLEEVGGFDERFPRAFREDTDLALRVVGAGYVIVKGERSADHPVPPADRWTSVRRQAGNADDVLMRARHGVGWRVAAGAEPGRNGRHFLTVASAALAVGAFGSGRRRVALAGATGWLAGTAELALARLRPGPRTVDETATMLATSAAIPAAALAHQVRGWAKLPALARDRARSPLGLPRSPLALSPPRVLARSAHRPRPGRADVDWQPAAVLFDRDGTLIADVPYNDDPAKVVLMPGARVAIRRVKEAGLAAGVVSNQSGIGRGLLTFDAVDAVNARVEELLGGIDNWQICPHAPGDGCGCRKPAPGLVKAAAGDLGIDPGACAVIGDIGADVGAATAAGARSVLVPSRTTRRQEIAAAPVVAADLLSAVDLVLAGMC